MTGVANGNSARLWDVCHDDIDWRAIGEKSSSGQFTGKQTIIDNLIDGGNGIALQAQGKTSQRDGQR